MSRIAVKLRKGADRVAVRLVPNDVLTDPGDPGGAPNDLTPVRVGTTPPISIFARWRTLSVGTVEGTPAVLTAELSRPIGVASRIPVVVQAGSTADPATYTVSTDLIEFAAGDTEARVVVETTGAAAAGSEATVILKLDPNGEILKDPFDGPVVLDTRPLQGTDIATLTIVDNQTGGTPTWRFSNDGSLVQIDEGTSFGTSIVLNQPAPEFIEFEVSGESAGGAAAVTAGPNGDYAFNGIQFVAIVAIEQGEVSGDFTITAIDNTEDRPVNGMLTVNAEVTLGTANPGTVTSFPVELIDDDIFDDGPPIVQFNVNEASLNEGSTRQFRAQLIDINGNPTSFGVTETIPVTRTFSDPDGNDFSDTLTANPAFQFGPTSSFVAFSVTANIDSEPDEGDTVTYRIPAGDGVTYRTPGDMDVTLTINARERVTELNLLPTPGIGGSRIVGGLVSVPNNLVGDLPAYRLNGQSMQVVAMDVSGTPATNSDRITSAFVYGVFDEGGSTPYSQTAVTIERDDEGLGTTPAVAGSFSAYPQIVFNARFANTPNTFQCSTQPLASAPDGQIRQWDFTGTGSDFTQRGPELVEKRATLMRLMDSTLPGTADPSNTSSASGGACGLVDVCITRFAGDSQVFLVEGSFGNGAFRAGEDPYAPSDWVDGEVYMQELTVRAQGFVVIAAHEHPAEGDRDGPTYSLLNRRAEDYYFRPGDEYTFRFAMVPNGASAEAQARARMYLRYENFFFGVGQFSSTRNPIQGAEGQYTLDLRDLVNMGPGPPTGYAAVNRVGQDVYDDNTARWETGARFRQVNTFERDGWWYATSEPIPGPTGSSGRWPAPTVLPNPAILLKNWYFHHCATQNMRMRLRDVDTGDAAWWWVLSRDFGQGHRAPVLASPFFNKSGVNRPFWFATRYMRDNSSFFWNVDDPSAPTTFIRGGNVAARSLSPTTRPWNTPEVDDPARPSMQSYADRAASHFSFQRRGVNELWWNARSYVAWRSAEDWAAWITRVYPPQRAEDGFIFDRPRCALEQIFGELVPGAENTGEWWVTGEGSNGRIELGGPRTLMWPVSFLSAFYGMATPDLKDALRGRGAAAGKGGPVFNGDIMGGLFDMLDYAMSPAGIIGRNTGVSGRPDPYKEEDFGPTNRTARTGALPSPDPAVGEFPATGYSLDFQLGYSVGALRTMRRKVFAQSDPRRDRANRLFRYQAAYAAGARTFTVAPQAQIPYAPGLGFGTQPTGQFSGSAGGNNIPAFVAQFSDFESGSELWIQTEVGTSEPLGYRNHANKSGWHAGFGAEETGDDALYEHFANVYGLAGQSPEEQFAFFFFPEGNSTSPGFSSNSVSGFLTSQTGGRRWILYANDQFWYPALCELQRRIDP